MWSLLSIYGEIASQKDTRSAARIALRGHGHDGRLTTTREGRSKPDIRLRFDDYLCLESKRAFDRNWRALIRGSKVTPKVVLSTPA